MRRILVDSARRRSAAQARRRPPARGTARRRRGRRPDRADDLLDLDEALVRLEPTTAGGRACQAPLLRRPDIEEAADALGMSPRTADRLWAYRPGLAAREIERAANPQRGT